MVIRWMVIRWMVIRWVVIIGIVQIRVLIGAIMILVGIIHRAVRRTFFSHRTLIEAEDIFILLKRAF